MQAEQIQDEEATNEMNKKIIWLTVDTEQKEKWQTCECWAHTQRNRQINDSWWKAQENVNNRTKIDKWLRYILILIHNSEKRKENPLFCVLNIIFIQLPAYKFILVIIFGVFVCRLTKNVPHFEFDRHISNLMQFNELDSDLVPKINTSIYHQFKHTIFGAVRCGARFFGFS